MVPAAMVAALRNTSGQFAVIEAVRILLPISPRSSFGTAPGSKTWRRFDGRSPDAGDKQISEERRNGEDMVGEAAGVGILLSHAPGRCRS